MLGRVVSSLHLLHRLFQQTHTLLADQLVNMQTLNCLPTHAYKCYRDSCFSGNIMQFKIYMSPKKM